MGDFGASDAGVEIIKVTIKGSIEFLKLTGRWSKEAMVALFALIAKLNTMQRNSPGYKELNSFLKDGEPKQVLEFPSDSLNLLKSISKQYGIQIAGEPDNDPSTPDLVFVNEKDLYILSRIQERYFSQVVGGEKMTAQEEESVKKAMEKNNIPLPSETESTELNNKEKMKNDKEEKHLKKTGETTKTRPKKKIKEEIKRIKEEQAKKEQKPKRKATTKKTRTKKETVKSKTR